MRESTLAITDRNPKSNQKQKEVEGFSPEPQAEAGAFCYIRKRSGETVPFDASRITRAIRAAGEASGEFGEAEARRLTLRVLKLAWQVYQDTLPDVEAIQDTVEEVLFSSRYRKTARAYILYREQHARLRELVSQSHLDLIDAYLDRSDWKVQENSNMSYSLQGLNNYISSEISSSYWLHKIYPEEIRRAHSEGDLHIHDLDQLSVYCVGWDLQELLRSGFRGAPGKVESAPAKHFRTALGQIVNFFYTLQGEAAGAQAFSHMDTLLAPFIRYDNLDYRQVKQALQEFIFNINVPTRVGFQTPFTNVTLDLQPPSTLAGQSVLVGGELYQDVYGDFHEEMALFNRAFLEVLTEGDAKGRVFTFPIPTYNITPDFNWEDPNLESLWEVTARYGVPYFANFVNADLDVEDARSMCCRLRLDVRELESRGGGLFGANPLTGSIGVVTVNMPRIGYLAEDEADFLHRLDRQMALAFESLEIKRKVLEKLTKRGLYPYTSYYLDSIFERHGAYWRNHFSTIGLVGLNEASENLLEKNIGTEAGHAFAVRVLEHMRARLVEFQETSGNLYNLEATPAEGASYRLIRLDKERFPEIRSANESGKGESEIPFYTNSSQLPVDYSNDILKVLDLQDTLQSLYTGGTVQHVFLGEAAADPLALREFVRSICENYHIPYFTISPSFSICPEHGYLRGEQSTCPECGAPAEIYSRVVGYLRPVNQWHEGKQSEFAARSRFQLDTGKA